MYPYLDLYRLELSSTHRCSAHCLHRQVEDELRRSAPTAIDPALSAQIVRRVAATPLPEPDSAVLLLFSIGDTGYLDTILERAATSCVAGCARRGGFETRPYGESRYVGRLGISRLPARARVRAGP